MSNTSTQQYIYDFRQPSKDQLTVYVYEQKISS